jgi:putative ABC transport system permease protein
MLEILRQVLGNLRANKLRSFLTMFGILWGIIAVVILSATGDGFQAGNQHLLEELGRNIAIVWGGQTSSQAGGSGRPRRSSLTVDDARALARESPMIAVVTPELERCGVRVRSAFNATSSPVHGIEPQYQAIRTIDIQFGRGLRLADEEQALRVAVIGADLAKKLFAERDALGRRIFLDGLPYDVIGQIRKKDQEDSYSGPTTTRCSFLFRRRRATFHGRMRLPVWCRRLFCRRIRGWWPASTTCSRAARAASRTSCGRWSPRCGACSRADTASSRTTLRPSGCGDTTISSLMFARMVQKMKSFFTAVGFVTLALGGVGVMNIMLVAVRERTREIGVRRAIGATRSQVQRQFFLEGFLLTMLSGALGFAVAIAICTGVNALPMPTNRFQGMIVTWTTGLLAVGALVVVGIVTSTLPARRAAQLPPVEALRYEI